MTKYIKPIFLFIIATVITACGGSDITPPSGEDGFETTDIPQEISQMIGVNIGLAQMKVFPGNAKDEETEVAKVIVLEKKDDKKKLDFTFEKPAIALGKADAHTFKSVNDKYIFKLDSYQPALNNNTLEGDKIPSYIINSFPSITITKVEIIGFICKDGAVYDTKNETFGMTYSVSLKIHYEGQEKPLTEHSLEIKYYNLKRE